MRALAAVDQLESEVTTGLISQLISRGYDSDELLKLSDGKISGYRRGIHLIMLIAHSCPDFTVHKHATRTLKKTRTQTMESSGLSTVLSTAY